MNLLLPRQPRRFVRIDAARCPTCGPKGDFLLRGRRYPLPVTVDADVVERTPWICGDCKVRFDVRRKLVLDVEVVT